MLVGRRELVALLVVLLGVALALSAGQSRAAYTFKIDPATDALNPGSKIPLAIHEAMIAQAIKDTPVGEGLALNARAIGLIQAGAEAVDLIHQWDSEFHFDNISVAKGKDFEAAFANLQQEMATAQKYAAEVSQVGVAFEHPDYPSFRLMYEDVQELLPKLLTDPNCKADKGCPIADINKFIPRFAEYQAALHKAGTTFGMDATAEYPNPDPKGATNRKSLFSAGGTNYGLAEGWENEFGLLTEVFKTVVPVTGGGLSTKPGTSDPLVKKLIQARDFFTAYHAYMALGHALHATQDFFAHSNYVELMAGDFAKDYPEGVPVELSLEGLDVKPGESNKPGDLKVPATFADFTSAGLKKLMGNVRYAKLESGWASTPWLEGKSEDYCASVYSDLNPIDPGRVMGQPGKSGSLEIVSGLKIRPGTNPDPPKGYHYCHYHTTTYPGLNKDEPYATLSYNIHATLIGEPSHRNFEYARAAAQKMSTLLFQSFWAKYSGCVSHSTMQRAGSEAQMNCRPPLAIWAGTWSTSTGGFALYVMDDAGIENAKHEKYAAELYKKLKCPGPQFYRGGYVDPGDKGKIIVCGTATHVYGRWLSNDDGNTGSFDILITPGDPPKFTGWAQPDGGSKGPWTGTWLRHFDGDGA